MSNKKRKTEGKEENKQEKEIREMLSKLTLEQFIDIIPQSLKKGFSAMIRQEETTKEATKYLKEGAKKRFFSVCPEILCAFSTLIEMLRKRLRYNKRGSLGFGQKISIAVKDDKMVAFFSLMKKSFPNWKYKTKTANLSNYPWTKDVQQHRWKTSSKEDLLSLLQNFKNEDLESLLEQSYIVINTKDDCAIPMNIPNWKSLSPSEKVLARLDFIKEKGFDENTQTSVHSLKMLLGAYNRPAPMSSAEEVNHKPRKANGKFTIEYTASAYGNGTGILLFNCKYHIYVGGIKIGN